MPGPHARRPRPAWPAKHSRRRSEPNRHATVAAGRLLGQCWALKSHSRGRCHANRTRSEPRFRGEQLLGHHRRRRCPTRPARGLATRLPDHPDLQLFAHGPLSRLPVVLQLPCLPHGVGLLPGRGRTAPGLSGNALQLGLRRLAGAAAGVASRPRSGGASVLFVCPAPARFVENHQQGRQSLGIDQAKDFDIVAGALAPASDLQGPLRL